MDSSSLFIDLTIILFLFLLNGFFAFAEMALVSSRKSRLQARAERGEVKAKKALEVTQSPNRFLSTIQIGITLIGILTGAIGGATVSDDLAEFIGQVPFLTAYSQALAFFITVTLTTYFSLVIGELIPKRLAMSDPERFAMSVASPMQGLSRLTDPLVNFLSASTDFGLRLMRMRPAPESQDTEDEIKVLLEEGTEDGVFLETEQDIVNSVFRLSDRQVDSIMTQRVDLEWIDLEEPFEFSLEKVLQTNHSRFPACHGSLDNVIGVILTRDLLAARVKCQEVVLENLVQPALFVPENMSAFDLMAMLQESGNHAALVIDEYGGLHGIVTLFDILKAIAGNFPDEGEEAENTATQREDGSWLVDGLITIDEFKELLEIDELPGENRIGYKTLNGFILSQLGSIPVPGQHFIWDKYRFEVMDMDGRRIDKVLVQKA